MNAKFKGAVKTVQVQDGFIRGARRGSQVCAQLDVALDQKLQQKKNNARQQTAGKLKRLKTRESIQIGDTDELVEALQNNSDEEEEISREAARRKQPVQGVVIDFLKRLKGHQMKETIQFTKSLKLASKGHKVDVSFKQALEQVNREGLACHLMQHITYFWKNQGEWKKSDGGRFRKKALELVQFKTQVKCLDAAVHNWFVKFKLMQGAHRGCHGADESMEERRKRLQAFWSEYHATSRKMDVNTVFLKIPPKLHGNKSSSSKGRQTMSAWTSEADDSPVRKFTDDCLDDNSSSRSPVGRSSPSSRGLSRTANSLPSLHSMGTRGAGANSMRTDRSPAKSNGQGDLFMGTSLPPIGGPESPTKRYLRVCQCNGIVPTPMPFVTGHSLKLSAASKALVDADLLAVTSMISNMTRIEEVDLSGNGLITEKAMVPFLQSLMRNPAIQSLEKLVLKQCRQLGHQSMDVLVKMICLKEGPRSLVQLDLSGINLAVKSMHPLCKAIRSHPSVRSVNLADVGLGRSIAAKRCIGELLGSLSVRELDLGWNSFDSEVFAHLGERLVEVERLLSLSIANCSVATNTNHDVPIVFFIEYLMQNNTLTYLDLSLNRIDFRGALVVEDSLEHHKKLHELSLAFNPLGVTGMRSILRLLCRDTSALMHFWFDGCSTGTCSDSQIDDLQVFSVTNPGGRYTLDLSRPYHRTLLRMLYKTMERFQQQPNDTFIDLKFSAGSYQHPTKYPEGWAVNTSGNLDVTFTVDRGMETSLKGISDCDFAMLLDRYFEKMRVRPGYRKIVPLFGLWRSIDGHTLEQLVMLDALAKDFLLTYPQIHQLAQSRSLVSDILTRLLHCVTGGVTARYCCMLLTPNLGEYVRNQQKLWCLLGFNIENPTGHYRLNLSLNADHYVADCLMLLDRWEVSVDRRLGRVDVSQKGNQSHVRNERYQDRVLHVSNIAEWNMPDCDVLEFDYVSSKRPAPDAIPLDKATWSMMLHTLHAHGLPPKDNVEVLRLLSNHWYFMALQLRELLGQFRYDSDRTEAFIIFFMRVMDMYNEKVFRVRFANLADLDALRNRLGWTIFFPFIQPEQAHFQLNFSHFDERTAVGVVLALMSKERRTNLRNPQYISEDGIEDPLLMGVPKSWETPSKMPHSGIFICRYSCAPEDRCFALRKKYLQMYGAWEVNVEEKDVMWWAALTEAPQDVLEYLEFLVARYRGNDIIQRAFRDIDGHDGNGVLTLREFEESIADMKCKKFDGPDEKKRIETIFRYLDPSGEGEVSTQEFMVLDLLWKEMQLSICEFVQFLERNFQTPDEDEGSIAFLEEAWTYLDDDGSGEITRDEWSVAIVGKLKYFGPSAVIFGFIDKDDEDTVSMDEFMALEIFRRKHDPTG